jgi:alpha-N-arabinofuranosidase
MPTRITLSPEPLSEEPISPLIDGDFIEFINDLIPAMRAEKLQDRSFEGILQPEHVYPPNDNWLYPRWHPFITGQPGGTADVAIQNPESKIQNLEAPAATVDLDLDNQRPFVGRQSARVRVTAGGAPPFIAGIAQGGIAVKQGHNLHFEMFLRRPEGETGPVHVLLGRNYGVFFRAYASLEFTGAAPDWTRFAGDLIPTVTDDNATLAIGIPSSGTFWLDKLSLLPDDHQHGWRADVVEAVRALKPGILRFGGSSLIYYPWECGIGPRERRAPFVNQPWGNMEENDVGLHEFLRFCELVEAEPLICVNSNSTTLAQVLDEIAYCNGSPDSKYGRIRAEMGHPEPFDVKYWQIGNEQRGEAYERTLAEYARAIRARHPELVLLASYPSDSILRDLSAEIDYVCPHFYEPYSPAGEEKLRRLIDQIRQTAKNPNLKLAITEWNHTASHWGWARSWLLTHYNALNAARTLNMFHRLGDQIRIANRSNLVNSCCSGILQTSPSDLYVTPCYHVQKAYANFAGQTALRVTMEGEASLDLSATRDTRTGHVALFVVNFGPTAERVEIDTSALGLSGGWLDLWTLIGPSLDAVNSFQEKDRVAPNETRLPLSRSIFEHEFPAFSVSILRFH